MGAYRPTPTNGAASRGEDSACSDNTNASTMASAPMQDAGSPATDEDSITINTGGGTFAGAMLQTISGEPGNATWAAGTVTVAWDVTSSDNAVRLQEIHICRINADDSDKGPEVSYGSLTGLAQKQSSGLKSHNVTVSSNTDLSSDRMYIVLSFSTSAHGSSTIGITFSELISTPIFVDDRPGEFVLRREGGVRYPHHLLRL